MSKFFRIFLLLNNMMDFVPIWYQDRYWSEVLSAPSALMTWSWGWDHRLRILKTLNFSFKFLRPHYFLTLSLIWFDENFVQCSHPPPNTHTHTHSHTHTHTHTGHVKIKVTDLEFSRNKICSIRRAILSGDSSCWGLRSCWGLVMKLRWMGTLP